MSWFCALALPVDPGSWALGTASVPVLSALTGVVVPALVVALGIASQIRRVQRQEALPAWRRALALLGAIAAGAAAAVPGGVYFSVRAIDEWAQADADRRASVGGLMLLPAWWIYTDAGRDDSALLRLEGPDGALRLSPLLTPEGVDGIASRLDGATVLAAIDRGLSPPWAERRLAIPSVLQGIAQRIVENECAALAADYGAMLHGLETVPPPQSLQDSSLAGARWLLETHLPARAWTLGSGVMGVLLGAAVLLFLPLSLAVWRRKASR